MARDMISVMAQLGFGHFSIAGHDRGGRVAYRAALDHPDRVDLTTQDRDLMPQHQDLHLLGGVGTGEERQPAEQPDHEQVQKAQATAVPEVLVPYLAGVRAITRLQDQGGEVAAAVGADACRRRRCGT
jgi:pimeloyl-ACP methyl ester carboxylesterase